MMGGRGLSDVYSNGQPVPGHLLAPMRASNSGDSPATLRGRMAEDGYLYLPSALDAAAILAARREVFDRLAAIGEISEPAADGLATGVSRRAEQIADLGRFFQGICEGPLLRAVSHGPEAHGIAERVLETPVRAFDFLWLRPTPVGRASPLHFDHVYMNRGSARVVTMWIPLGPVPASDGPLLVVEGSHRFDTLIADYRGLDVDRDRTRAGSLPDGPVTVAERHQTRLLTADFAPGDLVLFGPFTLHGSFENVSPEGRVRLSCDVRYQPAADPVDDRWVGTDPPGHGGLGYGGLSASRPLTAAPIRR